MGGGVVRALILSVLHGVLGRQKTDAAPAPGGKNSTAPVPTPTVLYITIHCPKREELKFK
jgi:hypothetical protein